MVSVTVKPDVKNRATIQNKDIIRFWNLFLDSDSRCYKGIIRM